MSQLQDMKEYQLCLSREIEARLEEKCDKLADALVIDDIGLSLPLSLSNVILSICCSKFQVIFISTLFIMGKDTHIESY